jgi:DNA-binding MarR family transcriptional regulator
VLFVAAIAFLISVLISIYFARDRKRSVSISKLAPIGEENAVTGRLLWKHLGMWSVASIKQKLNEMAAAGLIERKRVLHSERETSLYYRMR